MFYTHIAVYSDRIFFYSWTNEQIVSIAYSDKIRRFLDRRAHTQAVINDDGKIGVRYQLYSTHVPRIMRILEAIEANEILNRVSQNYSRSQVMNFNIQKIAVVELTRPQFATIDNSDLDYSNHVIVSTKTTLYSRWDYGHGLSPVQKRVQAIFEQAQAQGIDFVLFERGEK